MKKNKRIIFLLLALVVSAAVLYGYREYNRKPAALESLTPDISVAADALMKDYERDETEANKKYLGKVVEVKGLVSAVSNEQDTLMNISLGDKASMAHVSCSMSRSSVADAKSIKPGATVVIRGICTGYLMDVELNRCVLIK